MKKPSFKSTTRPSLAAQVRHQTVMPKSGVDWLLFGAVAFIASAPNLYSRWAE